MNKNKADLPKKLQKKVLHIILPKKIWRKFEKWQKDSGFSTTTEAVRYLIRELT